MVYFWMLLVLLLCAVSADYLAVIDETTLTEMGAMSLSVLISDADDSITLQLTGPSSIYFSIGIGSCEMSDSWALIVPGLAASDGNTPFEQMLGHHKAGSSLDSSFTVDEDMTYGLLRTVSLSRSLSLSDDLDDDSYYAFSTDDDELTVMWAYGKGADFAKHSDRDCTTLSFTKTMISEEELTRMEQLFSSDWSYLFGHSTASLVTVFILLAVVMIIAAMRYCIRANNWTKMKNFIAREEYIPI